MQPLNQQGTTMINSNQKKTVPAVVASMMLLTVLTRGAVIYVPNSSFENPTVPQVNPYAQAGMDSWQMSPQPAWYYPSNYDYAPWESRMGEFYNVPFPGSYIDNCDGIQAGFVFAFQDVAIFQDYNTIYGTNTAPSHAFNSTYNVGRAYSLTVGLIGGGGNMQDGIPFQLSLYYRDAFSNIVTVGATIVTNTAVNFPTNTHFVDFSVHVPTVKATDAWAGQNIGIELLSLATTNNQGGYWDVDNVRLVEVIDVPNGSFESPVVPPVDPFAQPDMDYWQKSPQPAWYNPTNFNFTPWSYMMGEFYNVPFPSSYIDNCDGVQAAYMFALPDVSIYQDYNTVYGTNTTPSHAFNAKYTVGKRYQLTVGLIGGGGNMATGVVFQISLYFRDANSNIVTVAATTLTNTTANFPTNTHLVDFTVKVPGVQPTDPWAGKNIGIQLLSLAGFNNMGGYWDVDNVRLVETVENELISPAMSGGQFHMTVQSEPGLAFQILSSTNISVPVSNWPSLGSVTNISGSTPFVDSSSPGARRYYRARLLP
jgi:hypothetical protein